MGVSWEKGAVILPTWHVPGPLPPGKRVLGSAYTDRNDIDHSISAAVEQLGVYALMGDPFGVYLPVVLRP